MSQIKTFIVLIDEEVLEIENFTPSSKMISYNPHTLTPVNNIVDIFLLDEKSSIKIKNSKFIGVVKFWGNISQEFFLSEISVVEVDGCKITIEYGAMSLSDKDSNKNKQFVKLCIPYIRDNIIDKILKNNK
jgi:hypothetical protein